MYRPRFFLSFALSPPVSPPLSRSTLSALPPPPPFPFFWKEFSLLRGGDAPSLSPPHSLRWERLSLLVSEDGAREEERRRREEKIGLSPSPPRDAAVQIFLGTRRSSLAITPSRDADHLPESIEKGEPPRKCSNVGSLAGPSHSPSVEKGMVGGGRWKRERMRPRRGRGAHLLAAGYTLLSTLIGTRRGS